MSLENRFPGEQEGRVALVTGGSSGIGRGAANELAKQGAAVVVHGLTLDEAKLVVQEIRIAGGRAVATSGPIDDPETAIAAVALALAEYGQLNVLVTSAGIQRFGTAVHTPIEVWDEVFSVNVKGVFPAGKAALPEIRKSTMGAIAVDEGARGVRVNSISPGTIETPMLRNTARLLSDGSPSGMQALVDDWGSAHALERTGTIQELGAVISFVTSPRASFMTGDDIRVDGGLLVRLAAAAPKGDKQ